MGFTPDHMSCILRACGKSFSVDRFLAKTKLKPCAVYRKGEPRFKTKPKGKKNTQSGINIIVSNADFDQLDRSIKETIRFLRKHRSDIQQLVQFPGQSRPELDFGIETRPVIVQGDRFPAELLKLAGDLGLGIMVSRYPKKCDE